MRLLSLSWELAAWTEFMHRFAKRVNSRSCGAEQEKFDAAIRLQLTGITGIAYLTGRIQGDASRRATCWAFVASKRKTPAVTNDRRGLFNF